VLNSDSKTEYPTNCNSDYVQARNQGRGSEWADDPRLSEKGPLSQVKESIRACNKIKISFRLTQSLLPNAMNLRLVSDAEKL